MQEQVDEKTVAISVKAAKITGRALARAMMFFLKKMKQPSHKTGKQSVKSLSKHGASLVDVPIDGENIGSFNKIARKYNLDFALKKDITEIPPKWYVFIKTKDNDALKAAMREYGRQEFKYKNRKPSILSSLQKAKEIVAQTSPPVRHRSKGGHEH